MGAGWVAEPVEAKSTGGTDSHGCSGADERGTKLKGGKLERT